jgi:DNA-binding NarL/FixJ family response regulator
MTVPAPPPDPRGDAEARPTTVVLVEDHTMVADAFRAAFDLAPDLAVVGHATTVADAERLVSRTTPDVAVIDFRLPDADGADAVLRLRHRVPDLRTLIVTSATDDHSVNRAISAHADGYLLKDQPIEQLLDGVRTVAGGGTVFAPSLLLRLLQRGTTTAEGLHRVPLSDREREVLHLLARGQSTAAMAEELHLSVNTVRNHAQSVLTKLGVHSRLEAVSQAVRTGLIPAPETEAP